MPRSQNFEPTGLPVAEITWEFPADRVPKRARTELWPSKAYSTKTTELLNRRFGLGDIGSWIPTCIIPRYPPNERVRAAYLFGATSGFREASVLAPIAEMVIRFGHFVAVPADDLVTPNGMRPEDILGAKADGYLSLSVGKGIVLAELTVRFGEAYDPESLKRLTEVRDL